MNNRFPTSVAFVLALGIAAGLVYYRSKQRYAPIGVEVGQLAPEIVGEDIEGKQFKLTDYRGKVVFLDFWGNW